jgi:hypothetical protein
MLTALVFPCEQGDLTLVVGGAGQGYARRADHSGGRISADLRPEGETMYEQIEQAAQQPEFGVAPQNHPAVMLSFVWDTTQPVEAQAVKED